MKHLLAKLLVKPLVTLSLFMFYWISLEYGNLGVIGWLSMFCPHNSDGHFDIFSLLLARF